MKLSEKIQILRKQKEYSQEELASICNVSRQSISKWEGDISLPETEKLLILSNTFNTTIDVLLKDELTIGEIRKVNTCGCNAVIKEKAAIYEGALIKESIDDETILDYLSVYKVELWNTGGLPKYWTVIYFTCSYPDFPELIAKVLISDENRGGNWFVDFKRQNTKYIVFRELILTYEIGNTSQKEHVCECCRKLGISDHEMNWGE